MNENILLYGSFYIYENIVVTVNSYSRERIIGFGNKEIMNAVYLSKLNFHKFRESSYMKNKIIQNSYSFSSNNNTFNIYSIFENEKRKKRANAIEQSQSRERYKSARDDEKLTINTSVEDESEEDSENINDDNTTNNNNIKKVNYFFEETMSQASTITSNSSTSFWNLNKTNLKNENHFSSKSFLNLQILLVGLLLILLVLIILSILNLKLLKNTISNYSQNYIDLRQFVRSYQQFSYSFLSLICIVNANNSNCEEYISALDSPEFNQSLFLMEQNEIMAEICSESISKIIKNSETINDEILIGLLKQNNSYLLMNLKKKNQTYEIGQSQINISFNDALLLLSNNMRLIVSQESKIKTRDKEPIYLIYGLDNPFVNIKNRSDDLSDNQIAIYTYLINYKLFVQKFSNLSERLNILINEKNSRIIRLAILFHHIILIIMILELFTIILYLITFNKILAVMINSIIIRFDIIFDDDNDFRKIFTTKICQLEEFINIYPCNPINSMREINKNYAKYKNLMTIKKRNEQRLNMNKKLLDEEDEKSLFKDTKKYISWFDIYKKGYNRFYIVIGIIVLSMNIIVYGVIFGIWNDYQSKSEKTLELINYSWNFERNTLRLVNFYHMMLFNNQTLDDITNTYFSSNDYNCIEEIYQILFSYYLIYKKRKKIASIYKSYDYFIDFNCKSLYDVLNTVDENPFSKTVQVLKEKYNLDPEKIKESFTKICQKTQSFIGDSVSPSFQSLYKKVTDAMILFDDRSYKGIINKIFDDSLLTISSIFLNVTRYIIYFAGKMTYTKASEIIYNLLGKYIIITLIFYIISEIAHFIFFFFIYIWNINNQCKNMFKLKRVFEVTSSND